MNIRMKIVRAVALEADKFYDKAKDLGNVAATELGETRRSQITGLESLANSTQKVSDVLDYIKVRTARHKAWRQGNLGEELVSYIENLKEKRDGICAEFKIGDKTYADKIIQQEVYMQLIRAFVAQLAAQYEFKVR